MPWTPSLLLGAGTFVIGAIAPLYDSYVPPLLERHLSSSAWVGAAMGIDNVLALLLVPFIGALSDATHTRLGRRVPFVLAALPLTALALAAIPFAERFGLLALLAAMIAVDVALAVWRAPFSALLAELVPSVHRSRTEGILGVAMCLGAMLVLGTARGLSARGGALPFVLAASLVGIVWLVHVAWLREPPHHAEEDTPGDAARAVVAPFRSLRDAFTAGGGKAPRFFLACLLFQMAFQSFSSWFTLHGSERFHTTVADVSLGFIAVAISTLIGSIPAGWLGARYGRRRMSLVGIAGMAIACVLLHLVPTLMTAVAVLFLFGLAWSFPVANLTPMALELGTAARAGSLAGAFLLVQSAAGVIGPSLVGAWFDVTGSKRGLFVALALFLAGAFALLATLAPGFGEAPAGVLSRTAEPLPPQLVVDASDSFA
ncbi:MAG TPA: MFS transporter [Gemmatimonadaceae bacterium]|jgi:maltose/moltooligosaccharide transporter|nr:MFS transporter [Gemmatimonadaceae bacterium]